MCVLALALIYHTPALRIRTFARLKCGSRCRYIRFVTHGQTAAVCLGALEIELWPFFAVDEACEVALDTIFLPVDLTYLLVKEDGEGESTPASSGDVSP